MCRKLNILILHRMGDPRRLRKAISDLEYMLPVHAPDHNYIVHPAELPLPEYVRDIEFHGIVLGSTFLDGRCNGRLLSRLLHDYSFIKESSACKVALPQDDYDCSAILDRWMVNWNIDILYSVCSDNWEILYPHFSKKKKYNLDIPVIYLRHGYKNGLKQKHLRIVKSMFPIERTDPRHFMAA